MANTAGAIKVGMIIEWSGSIANIPTGFYLCNGSNGTPDLRDRFVIGAGSTYAVGATGGASTHIHNVNGGMGGSLSAGSAIINSAPVGSWTPAMSTGVSINSPAKDHLPPFYSLCYIYTTVTGAIPAGAIVLWSGSTASIPTGWQICDGTNSTPDLKDKFVIGTGVYAVGDTGGATSHLHTFPFGGAGGALNAGNVVANTGIGDYLHTCIYSATCNLATSPHLPPYYALAYIKNTSGISLGSYTGFVVIWSGSIASIPSGWGLCNGTNSPDLRNRFITGAGATYAVNATGGGTEHTHGVTLAGAFDLISGGFGVSEITAAGGGSFAVSGTCTGGGSATSATSMPPYYALAYVIKQ